MLLCCKHMFCKRKDEIMLKKYKREHCFTLSFNLRSDIEELSIFVAIVLQ